MVTRRKNKTVRFRGSKSHGFGSMKKNRGAGNRGGRGKAGTGKRGDANKPSIWKSKYFGVHGFGKKKSAPVITINLAELDQKIDAWVADKKVKTEKDMYIVNLKACGYQKVLGNGKITKKIRLEDGVLSAGAKEKIEAAGGEVVEQEGA